MKHKLYRSFTEGVAARFFAEWLEKQKGVTCVTQKLHRNKVLVFFEADYLTALNIQGMAPNTKFSRARA